jgi:glycine/D-amino acid oxidase-like deaminating enzyme
VPPRRVAVVGGGIIGVAVARRVLEVEPGARVTLLEKEPELARHQTGRNSGVVHAGLYYEPGSLKARLCRRGVGLLQRFCADHDLAYDEVGKVLVALDERDEHRMRGIHERAVANGVPGVRLLDRDGLRDVEPHTDGVAALHSPHTAIVDYRAITLALAADAVSAPSPPVRSSAPTPRSSAWTTQAPRSSSAPGTTPTRTTWSCSAAGCRATGWPASPATSTTCASCRSAASTTCSGPIDGTWSVA